LSPPKDEPDRTAPLERIGVLDRRLGDGKIDDREVGPPNIIIGDDTLKRLGIGTDRLDQLRRRRMPPVRSTQGGGLRGPLADVPETLGGMMDRLETLHLRLHAWIRGWNADAYIAEERRQSKNRVGGTPGPWWAQPGPPARGVVGAGKSLQQIQGVVRGSTVAPVRVYRIAKHRWGLKDAQGLPIAGHEFKTMRQAQKGMQSLGETVSQASVKEAGSTRPLQQGSLFREPESPATAPPGQQGSGTLGPNAPQNPGATVAGTLEREKSHAVLGPRIPGGIPDKHTPHHLIGVKEAKEFPVMHKAAAQGYDVNRGNNLISLPNDEALAKQLNLPYHPGNGRHRIDTYVEPIRKRLRELQSRSDAGLVKDADLIDEIKKIEDGIRKDLLAGTLRLNSRYPWYPKKP
jgi:hypothetical protein